MSMTELSFDAIDAMLLPDRPLMEDVVDLHHKVMVFDEIDSTNDEAKRLLEEENVDDGTYLIANHQTAGRGRQGHSFYSPADTGLYVSMIRTDHDVLHPVTLSKLTLAAAVVCGILTESVGWLDDRPRAVVIGIGINCSTTLFPEDLMETAGALTTGDIDYVDRNRLAVALRSRLLYWTEHLADPLLLKEYRNRSYLTGKEIMFERDHTRYRGIVRDIDDAGRLLVELTSAIIPESRDQLLALDSGEVTLVEY